VFTATADEVWTQRPLSPSPSVPTVTFPLIPSHASLKRLIALSPPSVNCSPFTTAYASCSRALVPASGPLSVPPVRGPLGVHHRDLRCSVCTRHCSSFRARLTHAAHTFNNAACCYKQRIGLRKHTQAPDPTDTHNAHSDSRDTHTHTHSCRPPITEPRGGGATQKAK